MKPYLLYIALVSTLLGGCQSASTNSSKTTIGQNQAILGVTLKTIEEKDVSLNIITNNKASVFIFLCPECPLSKSYSLTLNDFHKKYQKDSIDFYGVFPGTLYTVDEIKNFQKEYDINFPLLLDTAYTLTYIVNATITPEVFVVDNKGTILYSGRIDNWAYEVSKKREVVTEHNLQDALDCIANNTPIAIKKTQAVGCFIETEKK